MPPTLLRYDKLVTVWAFPATYNNEKFAVR